jgi:hypothetical protein
LLRPYDPLQPVHGCVDTPVEIVCNVRFVNATSRRVVLTVQEYLTSRSRRLMAFNESAPLTRLSRPHHRILRAVLLRPLRGQQPVGHASTRLLRWSTKQVFFKRSAAGWITSPHGRKSRIHVGLPPLQRRRVEHRSCSGLAGMGNVSRLIIDGERQDSMDVGVPYLTGFHPRAAADVRTRQRHVLSSKRTTKSAPAVRNQDGTLGASRMKSSRSDQGPWGEARSVRPYGFYGRRKRWRGWRRGVRDGLGGGRTTRVDQAQGVDKRKSTKKENN